MDITHLSEELQTQLTAWAHEGTDESTEAIKDVMLDTDDDEVAAFAECAYHEGLYFAFSPQTEEEERNFVLGRLIYRAEFKIGDLLREQALLTELLVSDDIEREVHSQIMARATETQKDLWQYRWSQDFAASERSRLVELEDDLVYTKAWLEQARELFTLDKYREAPSEIYEHIHLDGDEEYLEE